jgi:hypothetical protein
LRRRAIGRSRRKGREEGRRRGADRWGPGVSDRGEKQKERETRAAAGRGKCVGGPLGQKSKRGEVLFFFFSFINPFQIKPFEFKFK